MKLLADIISAFRKKRSHVAPINHPREIEIEEESPTCS